MKFEIQRASDLVREDLPCSGAITEPETNQYGVVFHRWVIEINDLYGLVDLANKQGRLVFEACSKEDFDKTGLVGTITIYDDYLE
jgi:hypothetical protein